MLTLSLVTPAKKILTDVEIGEVFVLQLKVNSYFRGPCIFDGPS